MPSNLTTLIPGNFVFMASNDIKDLFKDISKIVEEYVQYNNEYIQIKIKEERHKNKRQKTGNQMIEETNEAGMAVIHSGGTKLEEIDPKQEIEKTVSSLVETIPDIIR